MLKILESKQIADFKKGPIRRSLFSNGAVSLEHYAPEFLGAKVVLSYLAGSLFEKETEHGIAHFIEHLIFKELDTNLLQELELAGAEIDATTDKELVSFELSCSNKKLPIILPKFFELFTKLTFTDEQLRNEREVIIQELREASDDHEIDALEYLIEKAHSRPLGHPVGGKVSDVKKISTKQIRAYFRKYFSPERMIITIASSYKDKSLRDILSKKFYESEMNKDKIPFRLPARNTVKKLKHINSKINKKMDSAILFISFDGPSLSSDKYYIYSLMDEFLFDGLSSVFFRKFREECPYVYGIDSSIDSYAKCGQYIMTFNTQRKHLNHLYEEVFKVLYDISMGIISLDTLELIKHRAIENWEVSFDSLDERADYIANNEAYELNELDITKVSEKIMQVDIKAVQNLARTLYNSDHAKLMVFNKDNK